MLDVKKLISDGPSEANIIGDLFDFYSIIHFPISVLSVLYGNFISGVLKSKIDYLKHQLGVESLLLKSVLQSTNKSFDEVMNFTNVDSHLESVDSFHRDVINYAESLGKLSNKFVAQSRR